MTPARFIASVLAAYAVATLLSWGQKAWARRRHEKQCLALAEAAAARLAATDMAARVVPDSRIECGPRIDPASFRIWVRQGGQIIQCREQTQIMPREIQ